MDELSCGYARIESGERRREQGGSKVMRGKRRDDDNVGEKFSQFERVAHMLARETKMKPERQAKGRTGRVPTPPCIKH